MGLLKVLKYVPVVVALLSSPGWGAVPAGWVPVRFDGGPLEVNRRAKDKALAEDASLREAIANWYDPATLGLLEGTPINCVLVTFSAGAASELEEQQHRLVKEYARAARERGIAVLGIVHPGADPLPVAAAAAEARLEGLVLDGEFPGGAAFSERLEAALRARNTAAVVVPIARDAAPLRTAKAPLLAIEGVRPSARDLSDTGVRAGASAEPWIESNIWLVRSFRLGTAWRPIWVNQQPNASSPGDYLRCVADAAVAGGRWIVALDDHLRAKLFRKDAGALPAWRNIAAYLRFAEDHADWRSFAPYGNLAVILDTASETPAISDEYLNLIARRQVPYRLIRRSELSQASLARFRAVLALDLAPPTEAERALLRDFAEKGGLVVAGPSWGDPPKDESYAEIQIGKGRVAVYRNDPPDPESVAKDMLDLLEPEVLGLSVFNVPSVITYASAGDSGQRVLVQLLNYATRPYESRMTFRLNGKFKAVRFYAPNQAPIDLAMRTTTNGRTEVSVPALAVWGAVLFE